MYSYSNLASIDSILWNMQRLHSPIASVCTRAGGSFLLPTIAGWAYQWRCIVQRYKQVYKSKTSKTWFLPPAMLIRFDPTTSLSSFRHSECAQDWSLRFITFHYRHSQYQFRQLENLKMPHSCETVDVKHTPQISILVVFLQLGFSG